MTIREAGRARRTRARGLHSGSGRRFGAAEIVVEIAGGHQVVAAITAESARQLGLAPGKRVVAVVKSTEVMIGVEG